MADAGGLEARLARVEAELAHHRELLAIQDVLTRYSRALDWLDAPMLDTVFYDDADIDYGFFKGTGRDFKPVLMDVERAAGRRWHFTAQVKIDLHGDTAEVESYNFSVATAQVTPVPPADLGLYFGYYQDRLLKRGGKWGLIRRKHLLLAGSTLREIAMDGPMATLNQLGLADTHHPEFRRLGGAAPLDPA